MMCMILSPNCCAVTIFEYSTSDKISNVSAYCKSEVYSKVESEPRHKVATIERRFNFRKRMAFSVLGSLGTVPFHLTLAVNNSGLKFVS